MKVIRFLTLIIMLLSGFASKAMGPFNPPSSSLTPLIMEFEKEMYCVGITELPDFRRLPKLHLAILSRILNKRQENPRWVAVGLCVALGPFGVHRMYLGTDAKVPIFYTLTLGGGLGVLPLIDLFQLLFTKDLSRFYNNPNVFIWTGKEA